MNQERWMLVVDHELGMRETLVEILAQSGYRVRAAADGDDALEAIRSEPCHVVVMDIRMPGRDGISVLREVGDPPPRVIIMTADAHAEQVREALEAKRVRRRGQVVPGGAAARSCGRRGRCRGMSLAPWGSVLVVDDDQAMRETVVEILGAAGIQAEGAASSSSGSDVPATEPARGAAGNLALVANRIS